MANHPSDAAKPTPMLGAKAQAEQQARQEREAAALRANLRKRKAQARAREGITPEGRAPEIKPG